MLDRLVPFVAVLGPLIVAGLQSPPPLPPGAQVVGAEQARQMKVSEAAVALTTADDASIRPIPLDANGTGTFGYVTDRFLTYRARAIAAAKAGAPLTADDLAGSPPGAKDDVFVVAFPVTCGDRTAMPQSIDLAMPTGPMSGQTLTPETPVVTDLDALRARLPGIDIPKGAIGQSGANLPWSAATVTVVYDAAVCPSNEAIVTHHFKMGVLPPAARVQPKVVLPAGSTAKWPSVARVSGYVDPHGRIVAGTVEAPDDVKPLAAALIPDIRWAAFTINGTPIYQRVTVPLSIVGVGEPTMPMPVNSGKVLPVMMSTTVNGRIQGRQTPDAMGISLDNSRCEVSDDKDYGTSPQKPIRVGGGDRLGPSREIQYLNVLRGSSGQGLQFGRLGSSNLPNDPLILDLYQVTFEGLPKPVVLYVDEYNWEAPKAPYGMSCAAPVPLTKPDGGW